MFTSTSCILVPLQISLKRTCLLNIIELIVLIDPHIRNIDAKGIHEPILSIYNLIILSKTYPYSD